MVLLHRLLHVHNGGFFLLGKVCRLPRQFLPKLREKAPRLAPIRDSKELGRGEDVIVDGAVGNAQLPGDLLRREALGHELQTVPLP